MLTKQDKNDIKGIVIEVIQDVIMPAFETVALKSDLETVKSDLETVKSDLETVKSDLETVRIRLEVVDRKVDRIFDNQLEHSAQLNGHAKRIKDLESSRSITQ